MNLDNREILKSNMEFDIKKSNSELKHYFEETEKTECNILDEIEEGYVEVDLKGRAVACNSSFCRITGYTREELLKMSYRDYMSKDQAKRVYAAYNEVFRTGIPNKAFHYEIIRKDGSIGVIENSISLLKNAEGHRIGFRSIVRDITERIHIEKELEKHQRSLKAIFRSVKDAIITVDTEMVVIEANDATNNICSISPKELVGKVFTQCDFRCDKSCHEVLKNSTEKNTDIKEYKIRCRHQERPEQKVSITCSPLLGEGGDPKGTVFLIRDITRLSKLEQELKERHHFRNIVGRSKKMQDIYLLLDELADLDTTILITGETGTGKSFVAKAIHYAGARAFGPLVSVNCSALPETLLESELFGYVKGAFTGALKDTQGRFQIANNGTIILEEIGDVSPAIQIKLLRILQEKEFERLGESNPIRVDVRIIATTNRDLKKRMLQGKFREDLYYRLKVMEIKMPPLRERREDIPLLVNYFCEVFNKKFGKNIEGVSDEVLKAFLSYDWPGNVRELEHSMEHAFILCHDSIITLDHVPSEIIQWVNPKKIIHRRIDDSQEAEEIRAVLNKTDWNKAKTARLLKMDRSTLYRKIQRYGLKKSEN